MVAVFNFYRVAVFNFYLSTSVNGTQRKGTYPEDKAAQKI